MLKIQKILKSKKSNKLLLGANQLMGTFFN